VGVGFDGAIADVGVYVDSTSVFTRADHLAQWQVGQFGLREGFAEAPHAAFGTPRGAEAMQVSHCERGPMVMATSDLHASTVAPLPSPFNA
jgi:hypothetical protein